MACRALKLEVRHSWSARLKTTIRRVRNCASPRYGSTGAQRGARAFSVTSPEWEPFFPMHRYGVFASRWPAGDTSTCIISACRANGSGSMLRKARTAAATPVPTTSPRTGRREPIRSRGPCGQCVAVDRRVCGQPHSQRDPGGGSSHQLKGSLWYFPQAYRHDQHGKLLLMAPSYDRSGAIGLHCVMDARQYSRPEEAYTEAELDI